MQVSLALFLKDMEKEVKKRKRATKKF